MKSGTTSKQTPAKLSPSRRIVLTQSPAPWQVRGLIALFAVAALGATVALKPSGGSEPGMWARVRQNIAKRAQVDLFDDFSAGLDGWVNGDMGASTWSYDGNGFVNPGALSLMAQSLALTDYDVDSQVQIEAKGVGLAFRAAGSGDYQAARLLIDNSTRVPMLMLERYSMVGGKASKRTRAPYPGRYEPGKLYQVHLQVREDSFTLYVQGQLVDYWTDPRLKFGGVGLFCGAGERARVAWIRVSHNSDTMGKLCALIASI